MASDGSLSPVSSRRGSAESLHRVTPMPGAMLEPRTKSCAPVSLWVPGLQPALASATCNRLPASRGSCQAWQPNAQCCDWELGAVPGAVARQDVGIVSSLLRAQHGLMCEPEGACMHACSRGMGRMTSLSENEALRLAQIDVQA